MIFHKLWKNDYRLIDVFITGPLQIYISRYTTNIVLKYFMVFTGLNY